ncbi:MAG: GGDEF domain-containing protein, partial [Gemmatimonadaceae bacterium]
AMGHPDSARTELLEATRIGDATGDQGLIVRNLLGLAGVDRTHGRHPAAKRGAARALTLAREMGSRELLRLAWEELSATQAAAGEHAAALASYTAFKALSDSIYDETTSRRVAGLERRADEERRRHEADRLRADAAILEVVASRRATQRDAVVVVAVLLGLLGLVAYRRRSDRTRLAEELSMTDALTGARNRRYVQQILPLDVATSLRRYRAAAERGVVTPDEADVAIFLLDLDHFKQVNDRFGHAAGDRLLVELATTLRAACRDADIVARWGGEEFLVVSRFIDRAQASTIAARLRAAVESHVTLLDDGRVVRVTCSLGYAVFPFSVERTDSLSWEEVVSLADHGSYAAKRAGRNFWVGYTEGPAAPPDAVLHAAPTKVARWIAEGRLKVTDADAGERSLAAQGD